MFARIMRHVIDFSTNPIVGITGAVLLGYAGYLARHSIRHIFAQRKLQRIRAQVRRKYWGYE